VNNHEYLPPDDPNDPVEEAAMAWLLERDEGFAPGREAAFARWRSADPAHAAAAARLEEAWHTLAELSNTPVQPAATNSAKTGRPSVYWHAAWVALGSAAAVLLLLRLWWFEPAAVEMRFANGNAGFERVVLADGSIVTLNAMTAIDTRFSATERAVVLASGEAHFDVAHETGRPFNVTANGMTIRVVGTAFNVRVASASVEVVVTSGKVRLLSQKSASAPTTTAIEDLPLLEPGDRAVVDRSASESDPVVAITRLEPAQLREAVAWQNELLTFENTPLREVITQFNLRNRVQLRLADPEFGERRVNGVFAANNVAAFVSLFERGGDVRVERNDDSEIVLRKAR
jgi:transmembrane sensor